MLHISLNIVSEKLKHKGLELEASIPSKLPEIIGDIDYLPGSLFTFLIMRSNSQIEAERSQYPSLKKKDLSI